MIATFIPETSVAQIHAHYIQFVEIAQECNLTIPALPHQWNDFWSDLCNNMIGKIFPISFHDLRCRHLSVHRLQQDLAKQFLIQCRDWDAIQDQFEYTFDLLKYLSTTRPDYFGVVSTIVTNPTITQEILCVQNHAIGYFLVWKDARNMLCHKSTRANQDFFQSINIYPIQNTFYYTNAI